MITQHTQPDHADGDLHSFQVKIGPGKSGQSWLVRFVAELEIDEIDGGFNTQWLARYLEARLALRYDGVSPIFGSCFGGALPLKSLKWPWSG